MIVLAKDAEKKFLEELHRHKQELSKLKCFYVRFSKAPNLPRDMYDTFLSIMEKIPESYMAEIYICEDKDVLILMHAFMQESFTEALKDLAQKLKIDQVSSLLAVYAMDEHQNLLEAVCKDKIKKIEESKSAKQREIERREVEKTTLEIMQELDVSMIETLARRRMDRRDPIILIIDDDQLSRTLVANTVRQKFECVCAAGGKEGLNEYINHAPDVVFLDIGMPDMSGHDVLECLFQMDPDSYIIMFSGRKDKSNIMRALKSGAQGFIGKPFTREKLFEYIGKSHLIHRKGYFLTGENRVHA